MKRLIVCFAFCLLKGFLYGQCSAANFTNVLPQTHIDFFEHKSGDHHNASSITASCVYTSNQSQYCVSNCTNQANPGPGESGNLTNLIFEHVIHGIAKSGTAQGVNGATGICGGATAVYARDCALGDCTVAPSIDAGANGVGIKISFAQGDVWDDSQTNQTSCGPVADPTFDPGGGGGDPCFQILGGDGFIDPLQTCGETSPIVIDTRGEGFHLTSAANGVMFDIRGSGHPIQIAWTDPAYHNAFLALDHNNNGTIDNGQELFGNFTQQPESAHKNGFLALSEFDKPENGGNGDGIIDSQDAVFSKLVLWIDENHDGISQPAELHALSEFGIRSLSLSYFESRRADEFGNQFRYKARVNPRKEDRDRRDEPSPGTVGRWAYDVFFTTR